MEGIMVVPPDRGTIIGRALWKPRYIVIGPQTRTDQPPKPIPIGRLPSPRDFPLDPERTWLSIYKSKTDYDPLVQHRLCTIVDCQVQMVAHRKQGPSLQTMIVTLQSDPSLEKLKKRRSSRSAGLTSSSKDQPSANSLWFRAGDDGHSLHEWAKFIHAHIPPRSSFPTSPLSPNSPTFILPFSPWGRDASDYSQRPSSSNPNATRAAAAGQHRPGPPNFTDSPSLRSKRSDISSHAGYGHYTVVRPTDLPSPALTIQPQQQGQQQEYHGEFIEGWTAAQGRSSTVSSPIRGRDSMSSQGQQGAPPPQQQGQGTNSGSSPTIPRETILDRAFNMMCIPGSEKQIPGDENLSSIDRFEALMDEAERRRGQREQREAAEAAEAAERERKAARPSPIDTSDGMKSVWDLDGDEEEEEEEEEDDLNDETEDDPLPSSHSNSRAYGLGQKAAMELIQSFSSPISSPLTLSPVRGPPHSFSSRPPQAPPDEDVIMPPTAQRALDFITGRKSPSILDRGAAGGSSGSSTRVTSPRTQEYNPDNLIPMKMNSHQQQHLQYHVPLHVRPDMGLSSSAAGPPPRPGRNLSSSNFVHRTNSQTHIAAVAHINSRHPPALNPLGSVSGGSSSSSSFEANFPLPPTSYAPHRGVSPGRSSLADLYLPSRRRNTASSNNTVNTVSTAPTFGTGITASSGVTTTTTTTTTTTAHEKRLSTSSAKRISFTEHLTKRLSSTSSLLLVQTNAPSPSPDASSSRGSNATIEADLRSQQYHLQQQLLQQQQHHQHQHNPQSPYPPPERCGWRGDVGAISAEGGFL